MTATALLLLVPLSATAEPAIDEAKLAAWVADVSSPDREKRLNAVTALTKAGPKAKPAVPAATSIGPSSSPPVNRTTAWSSSQTVLRCSS